MCFKGLKTIRGLGLRLDLLLVNFLAFAHMGLCEEFTKAYSLETTEWCPRGWDFYDDGNTCFRSYAIPKQWHFAYFSCTSIEPRHLAMVPDFGTHEFIKARYDNVWMGVKYLATGWKWVNDEELTYTALLHTPDSSDETEFGYCGLLQNTSLHKSDCFLERNFLCQTESSPVYHLTSSTSKVHRLTCQTDWMFYKEEETCFKVMGDPELSWDAARQSCRSMAADLAVLPDDNSFEFILVNALRDENLWIGMTYSSYSNTFIWVNGETLSRSHGHLDGLTPTTGRCLSVKHNSSSTTDCQSPQRYICQKGASSVIPTVLPCPKHWVHRRQTDKCYKATREQMSWDNARSYCKRQEADLARVTNSKTEHFIRNNGIYPGINFYYWIGLIKKTRGDNKYYWLDDTEENKFKHKIHKYGTKVTSACVKMRAPTVRYHASDWVLWNCADVKMPLCQKGVSENLDYGVPNDKLTTGLRKSISKFTLTCPGNWTLFEKGGICLGFFEDTLLSYAGAERLCSENGAHLAKISDRGVHDFVTAHRRLDLNYWIGLHSTDYNNDSLVWPDGTNVTFLNWAEGESTKSGCVVIHPPSDLWKVTDCADTHAVICQINHVSVPGEMEQWKVHGKSVYVSTEKVKYSSVQRECESFGKTELFLESDVEFVLLAAWLSTNSHAFGVDIWVKTSKLDFDDYRWANESAKVGEAGIWFGDSMGYPCYREKPLHDCCTFISMSTGFRLQEKACEQDTLFMCAEPIEPSSVSFYTTPSSELLPPLPPSQPLTSVEKQEFKESLKALKSISTSTTTSNSNGNDSTVVVVNKMCPCPCTAIKFSGMPSPGALAKMVNKIQDFLRVDKTNLISMKSKKSSAKDDRPSSQSIAVVAVIFGSVPFVTVIAFDLVRVYQYIVAQRALKN